MMRSKSTADSLKRISDSVEDQDSQTEAMNIRDESNPSDYEKQDNSSASTGKNAILPKYKELQKQNNDLIGWIRIDGTVVDYPVMQTLLDEEYYLHRDFDKEDNANGLPFMDIRCTVSPESTNLILYGHNMKDGTMFASLLRYEEQEYFLEHPFIVFDTIYEEGTYEVIAAFRTQVAYTDETVFKYYKFIQADNEEEFNDFICNINEIALYPTGKEACYGDTLLTLSTCEHSLDDGRFVVIARKV